MDLVEFSLRIYAIWGVLMLTTAAIYQWRKQRNQSALMLASMATILFGLSVAFYVVHS